jgi:hypothetical protein
MMSKPKKSEEEEEEEQTNFRECLLPFGSQSFVFPLSVLECKGSNIQNHNSDSCFIWV